MKYQLILLIFLISYSIETNTLKKAYNFICNEIAQVNTFNIEVESSEYKEKDTIFFFNIPKDSEKYKVQCSIPGNPKIYNQTDLDSDTFDTDTFSDTEDSSDLNSDEDGKRFLEEQIIIGSCQIENVSKTESFTKSEMPSDNNDIKFDENFKLDLIECYKPVENYKSKLLISFRQLQDFNKINENKIITFLFYGIISESLPKGHQILMDVNLIINNKEEEKPCTAICILKDDINIENEPAQGEFSCSILNIDNIDGVSSFALRSSKYISGIPDDNILINPVLTDKYISLGIIKDFSTKQNNSTYISPPSFYSTSIDSRDCPNSGKFTIDGIFTSDLENDLNFELPIAYPENLTATCSIKKGNKNERRTIECQTNGNFENKEIMIAQNSILDSKKNELLMISKFEDNKNSTCSNGKTTEITKKLAIPIKITFRQLNRFVPLRNKASFHFIGISDSILEEQKKLKMLVFVIINNIKEQKQADCSLYSYTPFNPREPNFGQADFYCEVTSLSEEPEDLQIISSDEILGINDNFEDYQKSPKSTDEKIKETENESSTLGKVLNFSSPYDIPPTLEINSMNFNNCEKGKITITCSFSKKIDNKFDFTIPFSYPSSSIKCTTPIIGENKQINIECKVQKDFGSERELLIEPTVIKKKDQEVMFIKDFKQNLNNFKCKNYNTLQKEIEDKKYEINYTFLQANSFTPKPGIGFLFKLLIYLFGGYAPNTIPINIVVRKKSSSLRNLQEEPENEVINCALDDESKSNNQQIKSYNCNNDNIQVDNDNEVESISMESESLPGLYEENSNPIETDKNIKEQTVKNFSKFDENQINIFKNTNIDEDYETNEENKTIEEGDKLNCRHNGTFYINGELLNKSLNTNKIEDFEIHFSNPPDTSGVCKFLNSSRLECQNSEAFEEESLRINKQPLANGTFIFEKTQTKETFTCAISSKSLQLDLAEPLPNNTNNADYYRNRFFNAKNSSSGLKGGTIAAIVIVTVMVLIGVGVLVALLKTGKIRTPYGNNMIYNNNTSSSLPPISNSSVDII